jgi:cation transport ATPase
MQDEIHLVVAGVYGDSCARRAATAVAGVHGVLGTMASQGSGRLTVSYDPAELAPALLMERLEEAGFTLADKAVGTE